MRKINPRYHQRDTASYTLSPFLPRVVTPALSKRQPGPPATTHWPITILQFHPTNEVPSTRLVPHARGLFLFFSFWFSQLWQYCSRVLASELAESLPIDEVLGWDAET